jgi:hypothetical protein
MLKKENTTNAIFFSGNYVVKSQHSISTFKYKVKVLGKHLCFKIKTKSQSARKWA